jgi:hypothetical protein
MCTPRRRPAFPSGPFLGDDLHQAVGVADDQGPAVAAPAVLGDHDVVSGLLGRLLRQPREADLGVAVDRPRHLLVVDGIASSPRKLLHDENALGVADVGKGGVLITSPTANTPSSSVRQYSSTSTKPLSSSPTFVPSRPRLQSGRRPTDITIVSTVIESSLSLSVVPPLARLVTLDPHAGAHVDASLLERAGDDVGDVAVDPGRSLGRASSSVTWVPRSLIIDANSQPMAPPPITAPTRAAARA